MKKLYLLLLTIAILFILTDCHKKEGCTDTRSINYDSGAGTDNGSCKYSSVIFYASQLKYNGNDADYFDVLINGKLIGSVTEFYPNGTANCAAYGCASYSFSNGNSVGWKVIAHFQGGNTQSDSGRISP